MQILSFHVLSLNGKCLICQEKLCLLCTRKLLLFVDGNLWTRISSANIYMHRWTCPVNRDFISHSPRSRIAQIYPVYVLNEDIPIGVGQGFPTKLELQWTLVIFSVHPAAQTLPYSGDLLFFLSLDMHNKLGERGRWMQKHYNVCVGVCGLYIVYWFNGTGLCCVPLTCIVHRDFCCAPKYTLVVHIIAL